MKPYETKDIRNESIGRNAVPIQLPLGSDKDFRGVINLMRMKASPRRVPFFARQIISSDVVAR